MPSKKDETCPFYFHSSCIVYDINIYHESPCEGDPQKCLRPNLKKFFEKWILGRRTKKGYNKKWHKCSCGGHIFAFGTVKRGFLPIALAVYSEDLRDGAVMICMAQKVAKALLDFKRAIEEDEQFRKSQSEQRSHD